MSFGVEILDHDDVVFTTTNNTYSPCKRGKGLEGFEAMFGSPIEWGHYGYQRVRSEAHPENSPTDPAAEVLYPTRLELTFLQKLYVPDAQHRRLVNAWIEAFGKPPLAMGYLDAFA
jgi:hypothetical protein